MTKEIGIRELKTRASELVRSVREQRTRYIITQRGKAAALLVPLDGEIRQADADAVWKRLESLREELGKGWQNEKHSVDLLSEMRR